MNKKDLVKLVKTHHPTKRPLIAWVSSPVETEQDLFLSEHYSQKFSIFFVSLAHEYWFETQVPTDLDIKENLVAGFKKILRIDPDLVIMRAGFHTEDSQDLLPMLCKEAEIPCGLWTSEQGSMRDWQFQQAVNYDWIIVNNKIDFIWYKQKCNKEISYMPFGCVPQFHKRVRKLKKYRSDIVASGSPLYYTIKGESVKNLVMPLAVNQYDLSVWGRSSSLGGWADIPYVRNYYRGVYPYRDFSTVHSSNKVALGITSNIKEGGYGAKLAKTLSSQTFLLWQHTTGIELDFNNHKELCWSSNPKETLSIVQYYLENENEREKIAKCGRNYAIKNLDYGKLIPELLKEKDRIF